jgi:hypothetical protein
MDGRWVYINKIFSEVTPEGAAPIPMPLRDENGNLDESKIKNNQPAPKQNPTPKKAGGGL